jgi:ribosomal protein L6P/L9E
MATQEEIQQVAMPTEVPSDLKVDLISIDGKNLTMVRRIWTRYVKLQNTDSILAWKEWNHCTRR